MKKILLFVALMFMSTMQAQEYAELQKALEFSKNFRNDSAYVHLQKALHLCKQCTARRKALLYLHYGKILKLREETDSSFYYMSKAEDIYKKHGMKDSLAYVKTSLAELFRFRILKQQAYSYIKQAEKLIDKNTPVDILAYYYSRRASIESMFYSKERSKILSQKILDMKDKISDKEIVVYSYNELAFFLEEEKKQAESIKLYREELAYAEKYKLLIPMIDVLLNISRAEGAVYGSNREIFYLEKALKIAIDINNKNYKQILYIRLMYPYVAKKNYKKAYEYSLASLKMKIEIDEDNKTATIAAAERKYNVGLKEKEIQHKNSEVKNAKKMIWLGGIISGLTLVVLTMVVLLLIKTRKSNRMLSILSEENRFLLSETNHRINNNLQLIIILINDELRKTDTEERIHFTKILSKVESIATLHRHLYKSDDKKNIQCNLYFGEIIKNFESILNENNIKMYTDIHPVEIRTDTAMYLGLLITELCINSIKHAFKGQDDRNISFTFHAEENGFLFKYSDNGESLSGKDVQPKLVLKLCRQLKIKPKITTDGGFFLYFEAKTEVK